VRSEVLVDFLADCLQLALLELGDPDPAPALSRANERGVHQLQDGTLAKGMRDHLGAPPFLAEQPLEQIGGADCSTMAKRETQMCDARLEVVVETGDGRR